MLNPDAEVNRLRAYLSQRGWMPQEIDDIAELANRDIQEIILDITTNAVAEATDYALDMGAEEFIDDMDVIEIGGGFMITTRSGRTTYTTPEKQMLPDLVRGGEVSEDGNRYKVIPIGAKKQRVFPTDIFSALQDRQKVLQDTRQQLNMDSMQHRSARAQQMATHWRDVMEQSIKRRRENTHKSIRTGEKPTFRTASEKQNPQTDWVLPAREIDLTGFLMDMNKRMEESIRSSVMYIIESYEREFA